MLLAPMAQTLFLVPYPRLEEALGHLVRRLGDLGVPVAALVAIHSPINGVSPCLAKEIVVAAVDLAPDPRPVAAAERDRVAQMALERVPVVLVAPEWHQTFREPKRPTLAAVAPELIFVAPQATTALEDPAAEVLEATLMETITAQRVRQTPAAEAVEPLPVAALRLEAMAAPASSSSLILTPTLLRHPQRVRPL